jgi:hypothetical protein
LFVAGKQRFADDLVPSSEAGMPMKSDNITPGCFELH